MCGWMQTVPDDRTRRFRINMPDTYILIFYIIILAALLTYIIPAGKFNMVESAPGQLVVDAKTFHYTSPAPIRPMGILLAIPEGLIAAAKIILVLFRVLRRSIVFIGY